VKFESEVEQAEEMVDDLIDTEFKPQRFAGDKAYDNSGLRKNLVKKKFALTCLTEPKRIDLRSKDSNTTRNPKLFTVGKAPKAGKPRRLTGSLF